MPKGDNAGRKRRRTMTIRVRFLPSTVVRIRQAVMAEGKVQISPWVDKAVTSYLDQKDNQ